MKRDTFVCLSCCTTMKHGARRCSCGSPHVHCVGTSFKSPGKTDKKFWDKLKIIIRGGLPSYTIDRGHSLKELKEMVDLRIKEEGRSSAWSSAFAAKLVEKRSREPTPLPMCSACGKPKDQHMGRRRRYKCLFAPTNYVEEVPEPDDGDSVPCS